MATARSSTAGNFNNHIGVPLTLLRLRQDDSSLAPCGCGGAGHEPRRRDRAPCGDDACRPWRWSTTRSASIKSSWRAWKRWREKTAASSMRCRQQRRGRFSRRRRCTPRFVARTGRCPSRIDLRRDARAPVRAQWHVAEAEARGPLAARCHTASGRSKRRWPCRVEHNLLNAAASAACALAAGAPDAQRRSGLADFAAVRAGCKRTQGVDPRRDAALVDDSYNANPDSVRAAIDVLAGMPAPRWLRAG